MTLVLGCLTHRFVVQVSDRRVTDLASESVLEDDRNKATMFCSAMAFAYSGLAHIDGERTDDWVAHSLARCNTLNEAVTTLRDTATMAFRRYGSPSRWTRHAFVGVGWGRRPDDDYLTPGQTVISNAIDSGGNWLPEAKLEFEIDGVGLSQSSVVHLCAPIGAAIDEQELKVLRRNLAKCAEHECGAWAFVRLLAETIRRVACQDAKVGSSLVAIVVPPPAPGAVMHNFTTPLTVQAFAHIDNPMFLHLPTRANDWTPFLPNFACAGVAATKVRLTPGISAS